MDDHAAVRHALALVLTEEGVGECREASGREDALEASGREPPDMRWWTSRLALTLLQPCSLKMSLRLCPESRQVVTSSPN